MMILVLYILVSVILVSLVSFVGIVSLLLSKKNLNRILLILVSLSAGTLLGGAFLHLLPESVEGSGFSLSVSSLVLIGIIVFFIIEKFIHLNRCESPHLHKYPLVHKEHKHHLGLINLIGDGIHNFVDGLVIAGAYIVSVPIGVATTIAVILHEVPQELADFGVLLYAGFTKKKAILFNFLSAAIAILGAIVGILLGAKGEMFAKLILPFAAGGFIYIAGSNLIPELHKKCGLKESMLHIMSIIIGMFFMAVLLFLH